MQDLIVHHTISDLYKSLGLPVEQELEFTIHYLPDIHRKIPFESPTFRTDYFSFVFIKDGRGWYVTDDLRFTTEPGTVYFTNPGHIKSFGIDELHDAYIITLTESFLRENVHTEIFNEFPFLLAETVTPRVLSPSEFADFETTYLQIFREFKSDSVYKSKILGNLFVVLLLKIKEMFWSHYNPIAEGDRSSVIVKNFKILLEKHFVDLSQGNETMTYQVQDFATKLHLHSNYFGQVIKNKTGHSVNHWIGQRQLATAKSLLQNTKLSIKEVGHRIGFSESTHFNRFFKKNMGITPGNYRNSTR